MPKPLATLIVIIDCKIMTKSKLFLKLKLNEPLIIERTVSPDMGHEFCAIVPTGIICPKVDMLLFGEYVTT